MRSPLINSAAPGWFGALALLVLGVFLWPLPLSEVEKSVFLLLGVFGTTAFAEAYQCRLSGAGLLFARERNSFQPYRLLCKLVGWGLSVGCVALAYWSLPEYNGSFYDPFYAAIAMAWPVLLAVFVLFIVMEDARDPEPEDTYFAIGRAFFTLGTKQPTRAQLKRHALSWLVRGFFLPLMFIYLTRGFAIQVALGSVRESYDTAYALLYFVDVVFGCMGYLFLTKLLGTHVRSVEPTFGGWLVAVGCYQPFWSVIGANYLPGSHSTTWAAWLEQSPVVYAIWAAAIIACLGVYVWATISFGSRFSNLTNRGIVACGPYAYCKHPAYLSKNISYFLITVPFVATPLQAVCNCLMWGAIAGIYYVRAKTEEAHLRSTNGDYALYEAELAARQGRILGQFRRWMSGEQKVRAASTFTAKAKI